MKPGELERNLSRLVEVARIARERLVALEHDLGELRHSMEKLALQSETGRAAPRSDEPESDASPAGHRPSSGSSPASLEAHGATRADSVSRSEGSPSGREVGSK